LLFATINHKIVLILEPSADSTQNPIGISGERQQGVSSQDRPAGYIEIALLCRDGGTHIRNALDQHRVDEYAALMRVQNEVSSNPIEVWHDGAHIWLVGWFHRAAAAYQVGNKHICVEELVEGLNMAPDGVVMSGIPWGASQEHRLQTWRSPCTETSVCHTVEHNQLSKLLGILDATQRRWRTRSSSSIDEDSLGRKKRPGLQN
jgi:hypothetical protein